MQEPIVGFEVAKLAKDKGFDWEVKTYFDFKKFGIKPVEFFNKIDASNLSYWDFDLNKKVNAEYISAPTQSLLQKWLREKYNIHVTPKLNGFLTKGFNEVTGKEFKQWKWHIYTNINDNDLIYEFFNSENNFNTFEEAFEAGLFEALKLIKNEN